MIPGMNPRQMQQAMKRLGIQQQDIEANLVIIQCRDKEIVIRNPSVAKVNMMGTINFQVSGDFEERELSATPAISEDDIRTVMEQTGKNRDEAKKAIEAHNGDIAAAILELEK